MRRLALVLLFVHVDVWFYVGAWVHRNDPLTKTTPAEVAAGLAWILLGTLLLVIVCSRDAER